MLTATPAPARSTDVARAAVPGMLGMTFVGGSVAVSGLLGSAPFLTAQAVRYAAAALILVVVARVSGRRLLRPRGREWYWLIGLAAAGQVVFNVALILGSAHAEPAALGVAVACVPIVLAVVGPVLDAHRPRVAVLLAAGLVTLGAVLVQGVGHTDAVGVAWTVVTLVCEAGFTLLAVPLIGRHGPWGISVHATWVGAAMFAVLGAGLEGPTAVTALTVRDLAAVAYLAVVVTAVAFVLWYSTVQRLGAGRTGLLTGLAPVAAGGVGVLLGGPAPTTGVWLGLAVVAGGLAVGLAPGRRESGVAGSSAGERTSSPQ